MRPLLFVDVETTGLDPDIHEIVEIGAVLCDVKTTEVVASFDVRVHPVHPERGTPEAYAVNGYRAQDWKLAKTPEQAAEGFEVFSAGTTFVGKNVNFDAQFLRHLLLAHGRRPGWGHRMIDITALAAPCLGAGLKDLASPALNEFLGLPQEPMPHRAIRGAMQARAQYQSLMVGLRWNP